MDSARYSSFGHRNRENVVVDQNHCDMLLSGFQTFYQENRFTDLVMQAGGTQVNMHALIACVASPVISMLCRQRGSEEKQAPMLLSSSEVDAASLDAVVEYMYYGTMEITDDNVSALLCSSNYLGMIGAVKLCIQYMCDHITIHNVLEADHYGNLFLLENLRICTLQFITRNLDKVIETDDWPAVSGSQLTRILESDALGIKNEYAIFEALVRWFSADKENRLEDFHQLFVNPLVIRTQYMKLENYTKMNQHELIQHGTNCQKSQFDRRRYRMRKVKPRKYLNSSAMVVPTRVDRTLTYHTQPVRSVFVYNNRIYSSSADDTIKVYNLETNQVEETLTYHAEPVYSLLVHDNKIYSGSHDCAIKIYNIKTRQVEKTLNYHRNWVNSLAVHNNRLYSGSEDKTIKVYNMETNQLEDTLTYHTDVVHCVLVHNNKLYSGSQDNSLQVYDLELKQIVRTFHYHTNWVNCLLVHDNKLYTGSADQTIEVHDLFTNQIETKLAGHTACVRCLNIYENKLYSGSWDNTVKVWRA